MGDPSWERQFNSIYGLIKEVAIPEGDNLVVFNYLRPSEICPV